VKFQSEEDQHSGGSETRAACDWQAGEEIASLA